LVGLCPERAMPPNPSVAHPLAVHGAVPGTKDIGPLVSPWIVEGNENGPCSETASSSGASTVHHGLPVSDFHGYPIDQGAVRKLSKLGEKQREVLDRRFLNTIRAKGPPSNASAWVVHHVDSLLSRQIDVGGLLPSGSQQLQKFPTANNHTCVDAIATMGTADAANDWQVYQGVCGRRWWCLGTKDPPVEWFWEDDPAWKQYDHCGRLWWHNEESGTWFYVSVPGGRRRPDNDEVAQQWVLNHSRWIDILPFLVEPLTSSRLFDDISSGDSHPARLCKSVADSVGFDDVTFIVRALLSPSGGNLNFQWVRHCELRRWPQAPPQQHEATHLVEFLCTVLAVAPHRFENLTPPKRWRPFQQRVLDLARELACKAERSE